MTNQFEPNPRQKRFIEEYQIDMNGTQAVIRAGYSENGASVTASRLLADPNIAKLIQKAINERAERLDITVDRVLEEYAKIAFGDLADIMGVEITTVEKKNKKVKVPHVKITPTKDWSQSMRGAVSQIGTDVSGMIKIRMHSKTEALEAIARHLGMFNDRLRVSGDLTFSDLVELAKANDETTNNE